MMDTVNPIEASGLAALPVGADLADLAACLRRLPGLVNGIDPLGRLHLRGKIICLLKAKKVDAPGRWVDAALPEVKPMAEADKLILGLHDPEPWPDRVNGGDLLADIAGWFQRYLYIPVEAADAAAAWVVLTHLSGDVYYATLLAILSATRQCGKSLFLDLLKPVVRRGYLTTGSGITGPVVFRLNELAHPTLLLDEGEKLAGRDADKDIIGLLNVGYRKGARVPRCVEGKGDYELRDFDAFGFRSIAAIGNLWDTLTDRAVVVRLERKPRSVQLARFREAQVSAEGQDLARRIVRWMSDRRTDILAAYDVAPRPDWLESRACDNWVGLFAVGAVAGADWPARLEAAARILQVSPDDEQDPGVRLVHDLRAVFEAEAQPDVIKSGDVAQKLNAIETGPWGEYRGGGGLSTQRLAALLRPFRIRPRQARDQAGDLIRGYWLADLTPLFERYQAGESLEPVPDDPPF